MRKLVQNAYFYFRIYVFKLKGDFVILKSFFVLLHFVVVRTGCKTRLCTKVWIRSQVHKNLDSFVCHSRFFHCTAHIEKRFFIFRIFFANFFKIWKTFAVFFHLEKRKGEHLVDFLIFWIYNSCPLYAGNGFFIFFFLIKNLSNVKVCFVIIRIFFKNICKGRTGFIDFIGFECTDSISKICLLVINFLMHICEFHQAFIKRISLCIIWLRKIDFS